MRRIAKFFGLILALLWTVALGQEGAVLTANANRPRKEGVMQTFAVEDDKHIYKGAMVVLNTAGYLEPATNAANKLFVGVAYEECDNTLTGHSQGGKSVRVLRKGVFKFASAGIVQADIGELCYVSDDNTVEDAGTATQGVVAGIPIELASTDVVWVDIEPGVEVGVDNAAANAD